MSSLMPPRPEPCSTPWRVAIVASLYNPEWVNGLVSHFEAEIRAISPNCQLQLHEVPGSFEIPLAVEILAGSRSVDAIATFGVLLQGATAHATLVAQSITNALLQTSLRFRLPVLHEILLVNDAAQAAARCLEKDLNRGTEAARAAVRMLRTVEKLRQPHSSQNE
ncbi:MAG: 6,7-dimethyl-8-ribityllumazine synthase [Verrucomicrobia bacterium]|nr:6,7-dimethyl-8-ribityllumazine synthase [Verrucomicrobiota bacterium]